MDTEGLLERLRALEDELWETGSPEEAVGVKRAIEIVEEMSGR